MSTARFAPWRVLDVLGGIGLLVYALVEVGTAPTPGQLAAGVVLLGAGLVVMYSLWIMIVATAFWVVRMDNLIYLLSSIFDAARWPSTVFRGTWRFLFTFVVPLALMTTYPAKAMLGTLDASAAVACVGGAVAVACVARLVWKLALRNYTSASS